MTMLPGAPSLHNIVPSTALGTKLTAAPLVGIVTSIVAVVFIFVFMKWSLSKSLRKKETFKMDDQAESSDVTAERQLPSFMISLLPIIVLLGIILIFSSVNNIIIVAFIAAILLSFVLFRQYIVQQKEVLNQGATESLSSLPVYLN